MFPQIGAEEKASQSEIMDSSSTRAGMAPAYYNTVNYPLSDPGSSASRLLFDFSIAISCLLRGTANNKILDFACGSGWTTELLNKLGYDVYAFDSNASAVEAAKERVRLDKRIDPDRCHFWVGNGHELDFPNEHFGNVFCFDSLHRIADYEKVFREMHRVLWIGGRAVFVEPGSQHSKSPETIQFLRDHANGDDWIEKDVNLEEIFNLARRVGFTQMKIKPFLLPSTVEFSYVDWLHILENPSGSENLIRELRRFAWEDRVIFHMTRVSLGDTT
jgi:SAM-dependent methyltransferase